MLPVLFKFGTISVYAWGFTLSLAILIGTVLAVKFSKRIEIESDTILDLAIVLVVGGIIGARLFYVIFYEPARYLKNPLQIFALWNGGLVYYGALIGGFIAGVVFVVKKQLPFWKLSDVVAPSLALGYGIVRIGCFMNGCCYGKPTTSVFGVIFPFIEGTPSLDQVARYPTQLFSSAFGFILFGILVYLLKRKKFDGQVFLSFLILYAVERFIIEMFRENLIVFANITISQLISILIIIPAVIFYWRRIQSRKNENIS